MGSHIPDPWSAPASGCRSSARSWPGKDPVSFDGKHYQLPLPGGTGLGKPLKLILHPIREHIPVYLGAEGPKNVALGAEICDGWLPMFLSPYRMRDMYKDAMAIRSKDFEIAAGVTVIIDDDIEGALNQVRQNVGFYVGGMGAKNFNVHKDHVTRMGFGARKPNGSRNCSLPGAGTRQWRPCPRNCATKSPWSARRNGSAIDCRPGKRAR